MPIISIFCWKQVGCLFDCEGNAALLPAENKNHFDHPFSIIENAILKSGKIGCVCCCVCVLYFIADETILLRGAIVKQDPRYRQKKLYIYPIFTNNIVSYLLWYPVIVSALLLSVLEKDTRTSSPPRPQNCETRRCHIANGARRRNYANKCQILLGLPGGWC